VLYESREGGQEIKKTIEFRWRRDEQGVWLELPEGVFGYDLEGERTDDGRMQYRVTERRGSGEWIGQCFVRAGEELTQTARSSGTGRTRVRAQMPGKILRVLARPGDSVSGGQALLVMEAMKMENEIRAPHGGVVKSCQVSEGQAVETGADLLVLEAGEAGGSR